VDVHINKRAEDLSRIGVLIGVALRVLRVEQVELWHESLNHETGVFAVRAKISTPTFISSSYRATFIISLW
jgi:hypothetical protein